MNKMTLSSRHRTRNSCPGGLRLSTLPLGHGGSPLNVSINEGEVLKCNNWYLDLSDVFNVKSAYCWK